MQAIAAYLKGWGKLLPTLVTLAILIPTPLLAFTWVDSSWHVVQGQADGAPAATFGQIDDLDNKGGSLFVNMGKHVGTKGLSVFSADRVLKLDAKKEKIKTTHTYQTILQNALITVNVRFEAMGSSKTYGVFNHEREAGGKTKTVGTNKTDKELVKEGKSTGLFRVVVDITYRILRGRNGCPPKSGSWENLASGHKFTFRGL